MHTEKRFLIENVLKVSDKATITAETASKLSIIKMSITTSYSVCRCRYLWFRSRSSKNYRQSQSLPERKTKSMPK